MQGHKNFTRDLLFLVSGLALIFLSQLGSVASRSVLANTLQAIGWILFGYGPINLFLHAQQWYSEYRTEKAISRLFSRSVHIVQRKEDLPAFILSDVEGCITPAHRTQVELRKLQRLHAYCQFVKTHRDYPQIVISTGRSQGYVELLAQCLDIFRSPLDLPFVIENGGALYHIDSKKTESVLNDAQKEVVRKTHALLRSRLLTNEFESKSYMVTVNPNEIDKTVDPLRQHVTLLLKEARLLDEVTITSSASAVDISPRNVTKGSALAILLERYAQQNSNKSPDSFVAIGDGLSDLEVLEKAGAAYCPAQGHHEVRDFVERKFGQDNVIDLPDIDFVIAVIEKECGVRL